MKPSKLSIIILTTALTAIVSYFLAALLISRGFALPVSPVNFVVAIFLISLVLLALAVPIWRYRNALRNQSSKSRPKRVDPFYAVRVVLLAKATAISGALFAGWHIGLLILQVGSAVVVSGLVLQNAFGLAGSVLMIVAGLVTEFICRLPDEPKNETAPGDVVPQ